MNTAKKSFLTSILKDGEQYAGIILGKDGQPDQHIILLPGEAQPVNWKGAKEFASAAGGELPTRREQSLLYANLKEAFTPNWYWSGEQRESGSAWYQHFHNGYQGWRYPSDKCRAVAVRRIAI
mgnify:CR=1 FL=1